MRKFSASIFDVENAAKWVAKPVLGRALWIFITVSSIGFYVVSAWAYYRALFTQPYLGSTITPNTVDPVTVSIGLERFGLSLAGYSLILVSSQGFITLICLVFGFFIFWRSNADRVSWIMSLILILIGTQVPVQAYALAQLYPSLGFMGFVTNQIGTLVNLVLIWIFPNGQFVPRWSRYTLLLIVVVGFVVTLYPDLPFSPFAVPLALILVISGLLAQVYRYFRVSTRLERQQTRWVILALVIAPLSWVISGLLIPAIAPALVQSSENAAPYNLARITINNLANILIPLAIGLSILRYHLWNIDVIIRRTLIYGLLTALLAFIYFGSVVILQQVFRDISGQGSDLAIILTTLGIAALFNPLRHRIQSLIDRRFYRNTYDTQKTLEEYAATAQAETNLESLSYYLVLMAQKTLEPETMSLWINRQLRDKK